MSSVRLQGNRIGGVVVELPSRVREVVGWIPDRVIPYTLNVIVIAAYISTQSCEVSITTDWLVSE